MSAASVDLAVRGRLSELGPGVLRARGRRSPARAGDTRAVVAEILEAVRLRGDAELRDLALRFDGVRIEGLEVGRDHWREAADRLDPVVRRALERARLNLDTFHRALLAEPVAVEVEPGIALERRSVPVGSAGVYAPGGRATYPSSVLMGVVPAIVAGVAEVVVCSPPGPDGLPSEAVMAACLIGGAHRLFRIGGAGAVAAMAHGTESVPGVDVIVGPGNRWVDEAKRQVAGEVRIDAPAGPSELLVVADASADPELVALELVAQAEHDPDARVVLVTDCADLAAGVVASLGGLISGSPRAESVREALRNAGAVLETSTLADALAFAQAWAPEHLLLLVADPASVDGAVTSAGTVFVGPASSVAFGDYLTGANHVLPTGGRARAYSGLDTDAFLRSYTVQTLTPEAASGLAADTAALATAEGLPGHAAAARARST